MAIDSETTGRFEPVEEAPEPAAEPYRDDDLIQLVDNLIDAVVVCRGGDVHDAGAQLSAIASLSEELHARLPEVIFEARSQDYRWRDVAARLAMPESTVRKRYADYVARREEVSIERD